MQNEISWTNRGGEIVKMYRYGCREMVAEMHGAGPWIYSFELQVLSFGLRVSSREEADLGRGHRVLSVMSWRQEGVCELLFSQLQATRSCGLGP